MKYWVLPANSKFYRYLDAFEDLKVLDWNVSDKNGRMVGLEIGDIVFLYGSQEKRLTIKCEVIKIPVFGKDSIEDSMYGGFDKKDRIFARLKFIQNINDAGITMRDLSLMGISGNIQSARKLSNEIVDEIESRVNMTSNEKNRNEYLISATSLLDSKKQIILYGPAGTGKTYNTKNIIVNHAFDNVDSIDKKYKELRDQGRVQFVTFHQSFAYEDFIEGIKPETKDNSVTYNVQNGIFKEFCEKAASLDVLLSLKVGYKLSEKYIVEFASTDLICIKRKSDNSIIPLAKSIILDVWNSYKSGVISKDDIKNKSAGGKIASETYMVNGYNNIFY